MDIMPLFQGGGVGTKFIDQSHHYIVRRISPKYGKSMVWLLLVWVSNTTEYRRADGDFVCVIIFMKLVEMSMFSWN